MYNIFVYGTLKKGGCNHHFLKDSEFVKNDVLKDHSIYVPDLFNFPLLLEDEGGKVHGEIYKIDDNTLANLDMLESEGLPTKIIPETNILDWSEQTTFTVMVPKGREHVANEIIRKL